MKNLKLWFLFCLLTAFSIVSLSYLGSLAVTTIAENTPPERTHCIVLDAGHGGVDGGATSCSGVLESRYNLEIALRLRDLFHLLGYETIMTRTEDVSIYTKGETIAQKKMSDLKERVRIVNEAENAILLSIHQNTFSDSRYHGAQVFYANTEGSKQFAAQLQTALVQSLNPESNRKCKQSKGIYLMEHITNPGVLIECGFLSNSQEDALLQTPEYQRNLCIVIAAVTDRFLSNT